MKGVVSAEMRSLSQRTRHAGVWITCCAPEEDGVILDALEPFVTGSAQSGSPESAIRGAPKMATSGEAEAVGQRQADRGHRR
jgi:hypothetical protein